MVQIHNHHHEFSASRQVLGSQTLHLSLSSFQIQQGHFPRYIVVDHVERKDDQLHLAAIMGKEMYGFLSVDGSAGRGRPSKCG